MTTLRLAPLAGPLLGLLALVACNDAVTQLDTPCTTDEECDDGLYCNGLERCGFGACFRTEAPLCDDGIGCTEDTCSEDRRACLHIAPDTDGDGVRAASCRGPDGLPLGSDCDDTNPHRYPGNVEVCDDEGVDEDCNPLTFGGLDADQDGLEDGLCCNLVDGIPRCGTDCDDTNPAVVHGAQVCAADDNQGQPSVRVCEDDGTWSNAPCGNNLVCVEQPNGLGVCTP